MLGHVSVHMPDAVITSSQHAPFLTITIKHARVMGNTSKRCKRPNEEGSKLLM
jgi:hypothetical protein